jgi:hypothetical protein
MDASVEDVFWALTTAESAVSRLDERLRACGFRDGWLARADLAEAAAWAWNTGRTVTAEALVLHDESMDLRMPTEDLRLAHGVVRARRKAASGGPELLSAAGVAWLLGRQSHPPSPAPSPAATDRRLDAEAPLLPQLIGALGRLEAGTTDRAGEALGEWLEIFTLADRRLPPLLQAAVALEGWRLIDVFPRENYVGPLLVAHWLRRERRVRSHLLALENGIRAVNRRSPLWRAATVEDRLLFWLEVIYASADEAAEALNRLELARQVAQRRIGRRRSHSHMDALLGLLLERPLVTAPMAAQRLKVSGQTVRRLIGEFGGALTEITGQARYRAWRL